MRFPWRTASRHLPSRLKLTLRLSLRAADTLSRPLSAFSETRENTNEKAEIMEDLPQPTFGLVRESLNENKSRTVRYTHNDLGELLEHPKQRVDDISLLHDGDLIAFPRKLLSDNHWMGYWHLAIVESIDIRDQIVNVIHYQPVFDDTYQSRKATAASKFEKGAIVRSALPFVDDQIWIVELNPLECLPAEIVLQRARSRIGENDYNILFNNCENFAYWCKTGSSSSAQSNTAYSVAVQHGTRAVTKVAVKKAAEKAICKGILKNLLCKTPTLGTKVIPRFNGLFAAVDVAVGTGFAIRDVMKAKEKLKEGKIDEEEYKKAVNTRVAVATGDMSCAVVGTIAGSAFAGPIGAVIGGTIGSGIGTVLGSATAKAIADDETESDEVPSILM